MTVDLTENKELLNDFEILVLAILSIFEFTTILFI